MALTTNDIEKYLHKYPDFKGVYAIDKLPLTLLQKPFGIVMNLDPSWKSGSHWTAIYVPKYGPGLYFDSYGKQPAGNIVSFLERNCKYYGYEYNKQVFQGDLSIKCGYFCISFLKSCFNNSKLPFKQCKIIFNEKILNKIYQIT